MPPTFFGARARQSLGTKNIYIGPAHLMKPLLRNHKTIKRIAIGVGTLVLATIVFVALFDWNLMRPMVARYITSKTGRAAEIQGNLNVHAISWTPRVELNGVKLKNPTWAHDPLMLSAKVVAVSLSLPRLLRGQLVISELLIIEPIVDLERDGRGRASWELGNEPGNPNNDTSPTKLPAIRRLLVQDGKLQVDDQIRRLKFGGSVVASDATGQSAFQIKANGTLNSKPFSLEADGAPLIDLSPGKPYKFSSTILASDIHLQAQVLLQRPFDLGHLDVDFTVSGKDLADVYYLTALALPNTPPYKVSATVHVSGTTYSIDQLRGKLGDSDISGKVEVVNRAPRPKFSATLVSTTLAIADLAPTLGMPVRPPSSLMAHQTGAKGAVPLRELDAAATYLLPDADLQLNRVRAMDADVHYEAASVNAPKIPMKAVKLHLTLEGGLLTLDPLTFVLDKGKFSGRVQIDARHDTQVSDIDMRVDGIDLSQFRTKAMKEPPLAGELMGRVKLHGSGTSVHKFASSVTGSMSFVIPRGEMTSAFAELTGINVTRGLGLLLSKNEEKTQIRCSVVDFKAESGVLSAKNLFIDTTDVLINGKGDVALDSEKLDLEFKGDPKKIRLTRIRSPITLKGTLSHPAVGVDVKKLVAQGAIASAVSALLTPAAAVLAFVDPALAKNKDCAGSVSQEQAANTGH